MDKCEEAVPSSRLLGYNHRPARARVRWWPLLAPILWCLRAGAGLPLRQRIRETEEAWDVVGALQPTAASWVCDQPHCPMGGRNNGASPGLPDSTAPRTNRSEANGQTQRNQCHGQGSGKSHIAFLSHKKQRDEERRTRFRMRTRPITSLSPHGPPPQPGDLLRGQTWGK